MYSFTHITEHYNDMAISENEPYFDMNIVKMCSSVPNFDITYMEPKLGSSIKINSSTNDLVNYNIINDSRIDWKNQNESTDFENFIVDTPFSCLTQVKSNSANFPRKLKLTKTNNPFFLFDLEEEAIEIRMDFDGLTSFFRKNESAYECYSNILPNGTCFTFKDAGNIEYKALKNYKLLMLFCRNSNVVIPSEDVPIELNLTVDAQENPTTTLTTLIPYKFYENCFTGPNQSYSSPLFIDDYVGNSSDIVRIKNDGLPAYLYVVRGSIMYNSQSYTESDVITYNSKDSITVTSISSDAIVLGIVQMHDESGLYIPNL